jgi:hypothetical protein
MPHNPLTEGEIYARQFSGALFRAGDRTIRVVLLLPESAWRPLRAQWWTKKEASIIGGDEAGNYILRLSDGSVQLWDHLAQETVLLAPSVRKFVDGFNAVGP